VFVAGARSLVGRRRDRDFYRRRSRDDGSSVGNRDVGAPNPICCDVVYPRPVASKPISYYFPNACDVVPAPTCEDYAALRSCRVFVLAAALLLGGCRRDVLRRRPLA